MVPTTHYAKSGDVHIAYQVVGEGPVDLVLIHGWISHLEYQWEDPALARFLNRLASFSRLIVFDKRGTGLSDRVAESALPTLEQRMDDIRAVMDAVGSSRAVIFGLSEGGPLSTLFAATYPARTAALIMYGAYAKYVRADDYPWAQRARSTKQLSLLTKGIGGRQSALRPSPPVPPMTSGCVNGGRTRCGYPPALAPASCSIG
jgi:pimeloyl-ACP methyl ester carboxylesterase